MCMLLLWVDMEMKNCQFGFSRKRCPVHLACLRCSLHHCVAKSTKLLWKALEDGSRMPEILFIVVTADLYHTVTSIYHRKLCCYGFTYTVTIALSGLCEYYISAQIYAWIHQSLLVEGVGMLSESVKFNAMIVYSHICSYHT